MISPEDVALHVLVGVGVALGNKGDRNPQTRPLQHQVLSRQPRIPPLHTEVQTQVLAVAQQLVPQELLCGRTKTHPAQSLQSPPGVCICVCLCVPGAIK